MSINDEPLQTVEVPGDPAALRRRIQSLPWHHQIELPGGLVTPGPDKSAEKFARLDLPSLQGKSVLDVGAFDGYFSFAAERLGADRVVALDSFMWQTRTKEPFLLCRQVLGSKVEDVEVDILDITPEAVGEFDVVFFLGVLYHMRDPMAALEAVASVTRELLVVETLVDLVFNRRLGMAFYPGGYLGGDATNWWGPTPRTAVAMIREFGFSDVRIVDPPGIGRRLHTLARNAAIWLVHRVSPRRPTLPLGYITTDRCVIHARR